MRIKTILFLLILLIALLLAVGLLRANSSRDLQLKEFIGGLNELTNTVVAKIGDPPTLQGIMEAQAILDSRKTDLKAGFEKLNLPADIEVNPLTETELDQCLANNSRKINDLQMKYLEKVEADMTASNNARAKYFEKKSRKNLNEMKNKLAKLIEGNLLLEEIKKAAGSYRSILE